MSIRFCCVCLALLVAVGSARAQDALTVVNAQPTGELASLEQAAEVRIQIDEWMPTDAQSRICSWHQRVQSRGAGATVVAWPAEYLGWARSSGAARDAASIGFDRAAPAPLRVVNPPEDATYLIDPTLRREFQTLPLRAAAGPTVIEWRVDGQPVGRAVSDASLAWPLEAGRHVVSARDSQGRQADVAFVVR